MRTGSLYAYGQPICIQAACTHMGCLYAYETAPCTAHTHIDKILVRNGTDAYLNFQNADNVY